MRIVYVNQKGTYTFSLPIGKMAFVITFRGIYPHYSNIDGIKANQLINKNENVITSVNNVNRTVSVYCNDNINLTQAIIIIPII